MLLFPSLSIRNKSSSSEHQSVAEWGRGNGVLAKWLSEEKRKRLVSICQFLWGKYAHHSPSQATSLIHWTESWADMLVSHKPEWADPGMPLWRQQIQGTWAQCPRAARTCAQTGPADEDGPGEHMPAHCVTRSSNFSRVRNLAFRWNLLLFKCWQLTQKLWKLRKAKNTTWWGHVNGSVIILQQQPISHSWGQTGVCRRETTSSVLLGLTWQTLDKYQCWPYPERSWLSWSKKEPGHHCLNTCPCILILNASDYNLILPNPSNNPRRYYSHFMNKKLRHNHALTRNWLLTSPRSQSW